MTANPTHVFGPRDAKPGPTHAVYDGLGVNQAWCGVRPQFRHWVRPGTADDVTCTTCLTRLKIGRPLARRTR